MATVIYNKLNNNSNVTLTDFNHKYALKISSMYYWFSIRSLLYRNDFISCVCHYSMAVNIVR